MAYFPEESSAKNYTHQLNRSKSTFENITSIVEHPIKNHIVLAELLKKLKWSYEMNNDDIKKENDNVIDIEREIKKKEEPHKEEQIEKEIKNKEESVTTTHKIKHNLFSSKSTKEVIKGNKEFSIINESSVKRVDNNMSQMLIKEDNKIILEQTFELTRKNNLNRNNKISLLPNTELSEIKQNKITKENKEIPIIKDKKQLVKRNDDINNNEKSEGEVNCCNNNDNSFLDNSTLKMMEDLKMTNDNKDIPKSKLQNEIRNSTSKLKSKSKSPIANKSKDKSQTAQKKAKNISLKKNEYNYVINEPTRNNQKSIKYDPVTKKSNLIHNKSKNKSSNNKSYKNKANQFLNEDSSNEQVIPTEKENNHIQYKKLYPTSKPNRYKSQPQSGVKQSLNKNSFINRESSSNTSTNRNGFVHPISITKKHYLKYKKSTSSNQLEQRTTPSSLTSNNTHFNRCYTSKKTDTKTIIFSNPVRNRLIKTAKNPSKSSLNEEAKPKKRKRLPRGKRIPFSNISQELIDKKKEMFMQLMRDPSNPYSLYWNDRIINKRYMRNKGNILCAPNVSIINSNNNEITSCELSTTQMLHQCPKMKHSQSVRSNLVQYPSIYKYFY